MEYDSRSDLYTLPDPSLEQRVIIRNMKTMNVIVDAVAGSGKTTVVCQAAQTYPQKNFLLLTYNKKLKYESALRVSRCGIDNVMVQNYHSFCFNKYLVHGNTDQMIIDTLEKYKSGNKCSKVQFN